MHTASFPRAPLRTLLSKDIGQHGEHVETLLAGDVVSSSVFVGDIIATSNTVRTDGHSKAFVERFGRGAREAVSVTDSSFPVVPLSLERPVADGASETERDFTRSLASLDNFDPGLGELSADVIIASFDADQIHHRSTSLGYESWVGSVERRLGAVKLIIKK